MFEYGRWKHWLYYSHKFGENKVSKTNPIDYALTIDTAKIIWCYNEPTKESKEKYFIEVEKKFEMHPEISKKTTCINGLDQEEKNRKIHNLTTMDETTWRVCEHSSRIQMNY
jgi:hypothetical protein